MNPKLIMASQVMHSSRWVAIARLDANQAESKARIYFEGTGESKEEAVSNLQTLWSGLVKFMELPDGTRGTETNDRSTVPQDS